MSKLAAVRPSQESLPEIRRALQQIATRVQWILNNWPAPFRLPDGEELVLPDGSVFLASMRELPEDVVNSDELTLPGGALLLHSSGELFVPNDRGRSVVRDKLYAEYAMMGVDDVSPRMEEEIVVARAD